MQIRVKIIQNKETEYIEIGCHRHDERVDEIIQSVKLHQGSVDAYSGESLYQIPLSDIYYIEAVDDRTYLYLENECYESRRRLYEFEEILPEKSFVRISKSVIVNMMKIVAIRPALNGRFLCRLKNDENVIISRKYVPEVREKLRG